MRICYILLSPTFGMHQYTADLANRVAGVGHDIHLITTTRLPRDRYAPSITIHTPLTTTNTGFSREGFRLHYLSRLQHIIHSLRPDLIHFSGPHLWNVLLIHVLAARGIPVIHTLHDLDPHYGTRHASLLRIWNRLIVHSAHHVLVHGQIYRHRLLAMGLPQERVTFTPVLHLFLSSAHMSSLAKKVDRAVVYQPWALFFGRLERYKGIECLLTACDIMMNSEEAFPSVVLAGPGNLAHIWHKPLPRRVEVRNRLIEDTEAIDLFRRCGLVVLPYIDATQSALIAAAYYFRKPVIVTRTGALPEYVMEGQTGYIIEPDHAADLAERMCEMLNKPEDLIRMGSAGRSWYDTQRTMETATLLAMYETCVQTHRNTLIYKRPLTVKG